MKFLAVCVLVIFALAATFVSESDARNSTWGYVRPGDFLLRREFVVKGSRWLQVVSTDVHYPPKGYVSYNNISAIYAIDRARKDGGYAILVRGGPGQRNATVHLKSERSHGLNFTVEFYGR